MTQAKIKRMEGARASILVSDLPTRLFHCMLAVSFAGAYLTSEAHALIRRSRGESASILSLGVVDLDLAAHRARFRGRAVELSTREFVLLRELMLNAGRVLSREQLEERLYP